MDKSCQRHVSLTADSWVFEQIGLESSTILNRAFTMLMFVLEANSKPAGMFTPPPQKKNQQVHFLKFWCWRSDIVGGWKRQKAV